MIGGMISGNSSSAVEKDDPPSTFVAISATVRRSTALSTWSCTMFRARSSETPALAIVASCRVNSARSLSDGRRSRPGMVIS